jgi:type IV secretory pathway ATPase VirB11/archaellum biosynthesis ATPase
MADERDIADDLDLGGDEGKHLLGSDPDGSVIDDLELGDDTGDDANAAPATALPADDFGLPARARDDHAAFEAEIGEVKMPDSLKPLFSPLPDSNEAIEDIPAEAAAAAEAREPEPFDAEQEEFESQIGTTVLPDSVRPRGDTGWVSAEGTTLSPEGVEIEWSAPGRLVVSALDEALGTPQCTEIHGYAPNAFSAKVNGQNAALQGLRFEDNEEYMRFVEMLAVEAGGELAWRELRNNGQGVLQMRDGSRLMILLPPVTPFPNFAIRKHTAKNWDVKQFVANGTLSQSMLDFLRACVAARVNLLVVGEAGSGKTTLLRALANSSMGDNERLAVAEQVPELVLTKPLTVPVAYREEVEGQTLTDRLEVLLYGGIDRLIVGEIHFRGITMMLQTMMVTKGSISTYHARTAEEAGERIRLALQIENPNMHAEAAAKLIRETLDVVIVLAELDGRHRVVQIMEVDWRSSGGGSRLAGNDLFVFKQHENRFMGVNPPDAKGRVVSRAREHHVAMPLEWFHDAETIAKLTGHDTRRPGRGRR